MRTLSLSPPSLPSLSPFLCYFSKMLLGKRPRAPMKRTTSMTDVALDLDSSAPTSQPSVLKINAIGEGNQPRNLVAVSSGLASVLPPFGLRRGSANSVTAVETAPFLRACALCKGLLLPGRDIFMYRGEIAFCSAECREQQIKLDERKEKTKCSVASRDDSAQAQAKKAATSSKAAGNKETVAAA